MAPGGRAYHVINRGNRRMRIFFGDRHYRAFIKAMADALDQVPMRILGWCLLPTIQEDCHLLCVLRYVEANALRAGLVPSAADWAWGSLAASTGLGAGTVEAGRWRKLLAEWPVDRPGNWQEDVARDVEPRRAAMPHLRVWSDVRWA